MRLLLVLIPTFCGRIVTETWQHIHYEIYIGNKTTTLLLLLVVVVVVVVVVVLVLLVSLALQPSAGYDLLVHEVS
jgi:hypothetical protein